MTDAAQNKGKGLVFILGDSRTGTTTLHRFMKRAGHASIHYFFKESGVTEPAHKEYTQNWRKLREFIDSGQYTSFSDYPLRTFYGQLVDEYPKAHFVLSVRKDVETWRKSMVGFFSKFDIKIDIDALTKSYNRINEDIRKQAQIKKLAFCEICIDDDPVENGHALSRFLELPDLLELGWENATKSYDNTLISSRATFYSTNSEDIAGYVEGMLKPSKAMLSEFGWVYLINDSSDFLQYLYGSRRWSKDQLTKSVDTLRQRHASVVKSGAHYLKVIVPEKSVVYPQFLPRVFHQSVFSKTRPATDLAAALPDVVSYPENLMKDVRSLGQVYFRGDSHANWLGAYFVYHHIVERLAAAGVKNARKALIPLHALTPSMVAYRGDLFTQLDPDYASIFKGAWKDVNFGPGFEYLTRYVLPEDAREAKPQPVEQELLDLLGERETFRFRHANNKLPKAVIFRDSTSDYLVDLLAEHFSESLFIWHKGHVYEDIIAKEKPDVVLHIMAERFVSSYAQRPAIVTLGLESAHSGQQ